MTTALISKQAQAEALIVELDAVQSELETATTRELFESCKAQLEAMKSEISALGFQVQRVPTGWKLVEPVVVAEVAQVASTPTVNLKEDEMGLYAEVPSSTGKGSYTVRVCAKWLVTMECNCTSGQHGKDCKHRVQVEEELRPIRPTFSQWIAGKGATRETINALLKRDRYEKPLVGSGVTGWKAASIERKLAA